MKKLFLLSVIAVFAMSSVNAQNFGVKAGLDLASNKVDVDGFGSVTASETGFYIGAFAEIEVSESFIFQPEVLFVAISDLNQIHIPLMAKIPVSDKFNVLAGPTLGLLLDAPEESKSFNFGIEAGASYDINEEFFVEARYNLGLADLSDFDGASSKLGGFFIGVGYNL